MILFYLFLLIIAAVPVVIVLPSLLRKNSRNLSSVEQTDQELANQMNIEITRSRLDEVQQHLENVHDRVAAEQELQATLLDDLQSQGNPGETTTTVPAFWNIALPLLIPVASLLIYSWIGNPQFADTGMIKDSPAPAAIPDIQTLLDQLEEKIAKDPDNPKGWELAATTYMRIGNYAKAEKAYQELNRIVVGNPDLLTAWADASILHAGSYTTQAREQIEKALSIDPFHTTALWLAGLGAQSIGNHAEAIQYFNRLKPLLKDEPESIGRVDQLIKTSASARIPATLPEESHDRSAKSMIEKEIVE